jgi:putative Mg2+ transporter-C (MgtC) family protein
LLGAAIGFERQWRQRMAGLRTNTLVAIGAASFLIYASLVPGDGSPTRVAAQVVSGIGFLGAGIIFREGLQVTGLNTAATLWCSAAVGLLAGSGHPLHAALAASFVILVNLLLRPLVRLINRAPIAQAETDFHYKVRAVCRSPEEAHIRALLLQGTSGRQQRHRTHQPCRSQRASDRACAVGRRSRAGRRAPQPGADGLGRKLASREPHGMKCGRASG